MKQIYILLSVFFLIQFSVLSAQEKVTQERTFTVVLDAGHGGHDPGAVGKISKEKDINLAVTLLLGKMIEKNHPDTRVIYTRKTDVFVPLHQRAKIANNAQANFFVSIHTNASLNGSSATGTETYVLGADKSEENLEVAQRENAAILYEDDHKEQYLFDPNSIESYILFDFMQNLYMKQSISYAQKIQDHFRNDANRKDRSVKQAGFLVLLKTAMPSVLVELGYISNPTEERYLNSIEGKQQLAQSLYNAFIEFKDEYMRKTHTEISKITEINEVNESISKNTKEIKEVIMYDGTSTKTTNAKEISEIKTVTETKKTIETTENIEAAASKPNKAATVNNIARAATIPVKNSAAINSFINDRIVYQLQVMESSQPYTESNPVFKSLIPIIRYKDGNLYRYIYAESHNPKELVGLKYSISNLFPNATVVAFDRQTGKHISPQEIIKILKENT